MKQNKTIDIKKAEEIETSDLIISALKKRATGYKAKDIVEEYTYNRDGQEVLSKRKETVYEVAPDMTAIKILLDINKDKDCFDLTEEELIKEKNRLLKILASLDSN